MEVNIKKFDIKIRDTGDYTDWFYLEEDKTKNIHHTLLKTYIQDIFIFEKLIPINFQEINIEFDATFDESLSFDKITMYIPEMRLRREKYLPRTCVTEFSTLNLNYNFSFME